MSNELCKQATENARDRLKIQDETWQMTNDNISMIIAQNAALANAELTQVYIDNMRIKHGLQESDNPRLKEDLKERFDAKEDSKVPNVIFVPPKKNTLGTVGKVLAGLGLGGAIGVGSMFGLKPNTSLPEKPSVISQENYRYNYLEARGLHVPPEDNNAPNN